MRCLLIASSVLAARAATPCDTESEGCTRAPCPSPPPDFGKKCVVDANPLVVGIDGKCCRRSLCDTYSCPSFDGCQCDSAGNSSEKSMFCNDERQSNGQHFFDCSRSAMGTACFKTISPESKKCDCLVTTCDASTHMLLAQKHSACVLACEKPETLNTNCADYDDSQDWCSYYAIWLCLADQAGTCQLPPRDKLEDNCFNHTTGNNPSDRLDSFLICLGQGLSNRARKNRRSIVL